VLRDGHCARRALAKKLNMEPGRLIEFISKTCIALQRLGTTEGEDIANAFALDYRKIETYPNNMLTYAGENGVKENEPMPYGRIHWGGEFKIGFMAHIMDTPGIVINFESQQLEIHWPSMAIRTTHISIHPTSIIDKTIQINNETYNDCTMIMYHINHYNAVVEKQKCQKDDFRKPTQLLYERIHTNNIQTIAANTDRDTITNTRMNARYLILTEEVQIREDRFGGLGVYVTMQIEPVQLLQYGGKLSRITTEGNGL